MNRRSLRSTYSDYNRGSDFPSRGNFDQGNVSRGGGSQQRTRKRVPPEQTHAENYYYRKQMEGKTPMAIVLQDGETVTGTIEWYDKSCIKIHRNGEPNLLVFKHSIKYLYKEERRVEAASEEEYAATLDEEAADEYDEDVDDEDIEEDD